MLIQGYEVPVSENLDQAWFDNDKGIIHLEYLELHLAIRDKGKLVRAGIPRVSSPTKVKIKKEVFWELRVPHPNWTIENPLNVSVECTPKNTWGPKDTLQKHTFGDVIKQELTDAQIVEREEKYGGKKRNLTPKEIDELSFLHQALAGGQIAPTKQYSLGKIDPVIDKKLKTEKVRFTDNLELFELFLQNYPQYKG